MIFYSEYSKIISKRKSNNKLNLNLKGEKMKSIKSIAIFGDSIMKGLVFNPERKRYMLSDNIGIDNLAEQYSIEISNRSRVGFTISKGTEMLKRRIEDGDRTDVVFLEYGGNDCDFNWKEVCDAPYDEHLPATPLDNFEAEYYEIIKYLRSKGITPIMANLPPICPDRYLKWICRDGLDADNILIWLGDTGAIYRYQEMYSRKVEEIARKTNTNLINFRDAFLANRKLGDYICDDGIHPNGDGQKIIHGVLTATLNKWSYLFPAV